MDRKKTPSQFTRTLFIVAFGAVTLAAAWHINDVISFIRTIIGYLSPAIIGFVIAFVLNVPMSALERFFERIQIKRKKKIRVKLNTSLALIITLILAATVIGLVIWGIVPHLVDSVKTAVISVRNNYPHALAFLEEHGIETERIREIIKSFNLNQLASKLESNLNQILKVSYSALSSVFSSVFVYLTSFILAIYMLTSKRKLKKQFNRLLNVTVKPNTADKIRSILCLANRNFGSFIAGQCLEALILGTMFFITLSLMKIPYAFLISILIAVTAIIPYVGAFIGFFIGAIMILMTNPVKALVFAVTFLVLQQLEEQLIYPRVVGKSVGLPPVWTLLALLVGGQVGGIIGMLLFIPLTSVVYALVRQYILSKEAANHSPKNNVTNENDKTSVEANDTNS